MILKTIKIVFLLLLSSFSYGKLTNQLTLGGIYLGKVEPGSEVIYQNNKLSVTKQGHFVIGFDRDAPTDQFYTVKYKGEEVIHKLTLSPRKYDIQYISGVDKKFTQFSEKTLKRIRKESQLVRKVRSKSSNFSPFIKQGFIWPLKGVITGVYGSQRVINGQPSPPHYGIDIAAPIGTNVRAPASGRVVLYHPNMFFSGGTLIIDHGLGVYSTFIHLKRSLVKQGQWVKMGEYIAKVGNTGRSTGPHLDWRVNWLNTRIDPMLLVDKRSTKKQ